ncbi:hypothetical protein DT075_38310 [Bacillus licheniformis]|nr:hypothetical protein DT075_38310 [Bacillus licheniformis]
MRAVSVKSDFYALGHFALFLLYSGFTPSDEEEKCWEEELSISFIVMEYIEGKTFEDLLFYDGRVFDEQQTISILKEVLHSVSLLHSRGIIHRDLRIPNLIVNRGTIRIMGSYGITYLAEELGRSGFRVIKQQRKTKAWTSAGWRSFNREAEILRELDLPAAPRLYEVLRAAGERSEIIQKVQQQRL